MTGKWNYLPLTPQEQKIETALARRYASCPPVSELLVQRGVTSVEDAERFFNPRLKYLHDPFLMPDMQKAVDRLNRAMGAKEKIMVYGDYDVDGTTAVALVYKYLSNFYSNIDYFIPTRYEEGYGISSDIIDDFAGQGVKLVIILDCGIKANEEIAHAREHGIDFIICDHHVPDQELPEAVAILNPKMPGSTYPCPHLSGCGVGYKLMQAFAISNGIQQNELEGMLDLVAVSIAADIVPMVDENRIMAFYGLRRLNTNPNMGLRAIIRICNLSNREITISDVIFKIGPRINASGRMQSGKEAVDLLVSRDVADAYERAKAELAQAEDQLTIVRDGVSAANAQSSNTLVRSTVTGVVLEVPVKVGSSVIQANTFNDGTTVAKVADMTDLLFKGKVDETEVDLLSEGMNVRISVGAVSGSDYEAVIEKIAPMATDENGTNTFEVKAALRGADSAKLRAGYSANATVILERADSVMALPESVVEYVADSAFVYVLKSEQPTQQFERTAIKTGVSDGINVQLLSPEFKPETRLRGSEAKK